MDAIFQAKSLADWSGLSSPVVISMRCFHSFVHPKIVSFKGHGLWISSSESLSHVCIMQFLSVAKLHIAETEANKCSEDESSEALVCVDVEIVWHGGSLSQEILG